jgi:hypothetical protein
MLWRMPSDLEALIWIESVAYFVSKLVNHQRRAPTVSDLRMQVAMSSSGDLGREAMRLALDRRLSEILLVRQGRKRPPQVRPRRKASYFEAARILGSMLGERLYAAYRSRKLKKTEIAQWMKHDVTRSGFLSVYEGILKRLGEVAGDDGFSKSRRERL